MSLTRTPLYAESWNVAYRSKIEGDILDSNSGEFTVIKNNFRYWAADPFVFEYEGETYIFAELYDYIKRRGVLGYSKFEKNKFSRWKPIIEESYHLSYPHIFEYKGDIYILPESSESNKLYLYKCKRFPDEWEKVKVLSKDLKCVDTTIFNKGEKLYLFTQCLEDNIGDYYLVSDENFNILYKIKLKENDPETYRSGGKVFTKNKNYIRVCQDCKKYYGHSLIFYEFKIDENNSYKDKIIKKLTTDDIKIDKKLLLDGIHTYNSSQNIEVIDLKTRRLNLLNLLFRCINKIETRVIKNGD